MEDAKWYVIHTYSSYEKKVKDSIDNAVKNRQLDHLILEVSVPTEMVTEVVELRGKQVEREVESKIFPGYVFIHMIMTDDSWYVVRNIRGVTGFIGEGNKPIPLSDQEVARFRVEHTGTVAVDYEVGDSVMITGGTMNGFIGVVESINLAEKTVNMQVNIMGKTSTAEVPITQVKPLE